MRFSPVEGAKADNPDLVVSNKVPDDATVVVVAGPREMIKEPGLSALRAFMNPTDPSKKPGKMIALFDVVESPDKKMVQTGLEPLALEFGVQVGDDIILRLGPGIDNASQAFYGWSY